MTFFDNLKNKARFGERWLGRRIGQFSSFGKKVADFTAKASKRVGDFSSKAGQYIAESVPALSVIPGVGEAAVGLATGAVGALDGLTGASGLINAAANKASNLADRGNQLASELKSNKYSNRILT